MCLSIEGCILSSQKETYSLSCLQTRGQSGQPERVSPMGSSRMKPPKEMTWVSASVDSVFAE